MPSSWKEDERFFVSCKDIQTVVHELSFLFFLTDPIPESANESLPESVVRVLLVGCESAFPALPPTGQSILTAI